MTGYKFIVVSFFIFMCSSCTTKNENGTDSPLDIIPHGQMANILIDVHLADAEIKLLKKQKENTLSQADFLIMQNRVFEAHQVSNTQFNQSLSYYTAHAEQLDSIYSTVIKVLEEKKLSINSSPPSQKDLNPGNK